MRYHSNADCELVIDADERMHVLGWDSKPFARCAWCSDLLLVVHADRHGCTNREALVTTDSVRYRSKADGELVIDADERIHVLGWDSKSFACNAHM